MNSTKYYIINPYNKNITNKLINKYPDIYKILYNLTIEKDEKEYLKEIDKNNIINFLFCEEKNEEITTILNLTIEKDRKISTITPTSYNNNNIKKAIDEAILYMNNSNIKDIFIKVDKDNKKLINMLNKDNIESLGELEKEHIFIKENIKQIGRKIKWNY